MKFGIGQPITRIEDRRLLTGGGCYAADVAAAGAACGFVLRSPYAHADIAAIDTTAARTMPGVLAVLTHADVIADGLGDMPCLVEVPNRDGTPRADAPRPVLVNGRVRHVGDPVAFVVAETLDQARDAAEAIAVEYAERPAVVDTATADEPGQPLVWEHMPNNLCFHWENGDRAAVDAAFARAAHVTRLELVNNRVVSNPMEPRSVLAEYDAASDRSTLHTPSQGVHVLLPQLADTVLKIGVEKLRILSRDVGGGFGTRAFLYPEHALALWASRRLRRAVRWTGERTEIFMTDAQARDNVSVGELAIDADGIILALKVETRASLGAYLSNFGPFVASQAGTGMLTGVYAIPVAYVAVKGVMSNTVPTDAYRGAGRPEAAYLIERLIDVAARELKLAPADLRRRNFVPPEAMPYDTALGYRYDSGEFATVMERAMAQADWDSFAERRAVAAGRGRLRGIGLATYIERCGGGFPETVELEFGADESVTLITGSQQNGQGQHTAFVQILSDSLGIDAESIRIVLGDSDRVPWGMTGGSRAAPVSGSAILGAAGQVIDKGRAIAANLLEAAAVDIEYGDGAYTVVGTDRRVDLFAVARAARDPALLPEGMEPSLDQSHTRVPENHTFPNGCHVCEVEIDPETGALEIVHYTVVDDFGAVINPLLLQGQVHGGIAQGLGQALTEHTVYEPGTGQFLTASFMDYAMPRADLLPTFEFATHNVPCRTNPLGVKGAGEAGTIGAMPAVINAIVDALEPVTGRHHINMPATPMAIWRALQSGENLS